MLSEWPRRGSLQATMIQQETATSYQTSVLSGIGHFPSLSHTQALKLKAVSTDRSPVTGLFATAAGGMGCCCCFVEGPPRPRWNNKERAISVDMDEADCSDGICTVSWSFHFGWILVVGPWAAERIEPCCGFAEWRSRSPRMPQLCRCNCAATVFLFFRIELWLNGNFLWKCDVQKSSFSYLAPSQERTGSSCTMSDLY